MCLISFLEFIKSLQSGLLFPLADLDLLVELIQFKLVFDDPNFPKRVGLVGSLEEDSAWLRDLLRSNSSSCFRSIVLLLIIRTKLEFILGRRDIVRIFISFGRYLLLVTLIRVQGSSTIRSEPLFD